MIIIFFPKIIIGYNAFRINHDEPPRPRATTTMFFGRRRRWRLAFRFQAIFGKTQTRDRPARARLSEADIISRRLQTVRDIWHNIIILSRLYGWVITLFLPYKLYDISMLERKTRQYNIIFIYLRVTTVMMMTMMTMLMMIIIIMIWHLQISTRYT